MNIKKFNQLTELLDPKKVEMKMSIKTEKYIICTAGSIDIREIKESDLHHNINGIDIKIDEKMKYKNIYMKTKFTPNLGDGFDINVK